MNKILEDDLILDLRDYAGTALTRTRHPLACTRRPTAAGGGIAYR
jgi:hypothetical protein